MAYELLVAEEFWRLLRKAGNRALGERLVRALRKLPEWKAVQQHPSGFRFPGGESLAGMQLRFVSALQELAAEHPGGVIVAVSHADPIRAAVADALGSHLDMFQRVVVGTASVTAIVYGELGSAVLTVNAYGDLTQLGAKADGQQ